MLISISVLRLISILFLVVYHIYEPNYSFLVVFVDIFFFLSCFLLFNRFLDSSYSSFSSAFRKYSRYLLKRFCYLSGVSLAVLSPIFAFIVLFFPLPYSSIHSFGGSLFLVKNLQLIRSNQDYFNSANLDYFKHLWYLSVDFQLAIVSILFLFFLLLFQKHSYRLFILSLSLVLCFISSALLLHHDFIQFYYNPIVRLWIIPFAALFSFALTNKAMFKNIWIFQILLLTLLVPTSLYFRVNYSLLSFAALFIAASCICLEATSSFSYFNLNLHRPAHTVIQASNYVFFIYLIHYPVILLLKILLSSSSLLSQSHLFVILLFVCLCSASIYHLYLAKKLLIPFLSSTILSLAILPPFLVPLLPTLRERISPILSIRKLSSGPLYVPNLPSACLNSNESLIVCLKGKPLSETRYSNYSSLGIGDSFSFDLPYYVESIFPKETNLPTLTGYNLFINRINHSTEMVYPKAVLSSFPNLKTVYFNFSPSRFKSQGDLLTLGGDTRMQETDFLYNLKNDIQYFIDHNISVIFVEGHPFGCNVFAFNNSVLTGHNNSCVRTSLESSLNLHDFLENNFSGRVQLVQYPLNQANLTCRTPTSPMIYDAAGHVLPAAYPYLGCLYSSTK